MNVQFIEKDGRPEWAVIPYETFQCLVEEAEMLQDIRAYDEAKEALARGEELIPGEVTYAILDGEHPVRVWREYRGMTQRELAEATGISMAYLSQIETGKRKGSTEVLVKISSALHVALDDIVAI
jgi:DNA-binding XRE family transcriptional regulator